MTTITDKLAAALLEASDYLAEFMEEGREHRVIKAADAALAGYETAKAAPVSFDRIRALHRAGFYVGPRDPARNSAHAGAWMVAETLDCGPTTDASTGGFCIVGDDLADLVDEAYNVFDFEGPVP